MTHSGWSQPPAPPNQSTWGAPIPPGRPGWESTAQPWQSAQQSWQQPAQPWPTPPPPPTRSPVVMVIIGLAIVIALGFTAFAVTSALVRQAASPEEPAAPTSAAPADPSPSPSQTEPTPDPAPDPEPGDGYDPPELPQPQTWDEATAWLQANALYEQEATPSTCVIARLDDPTPPALEVMDSHLNHTMDCLMEVWSAPAAAAGFVLPQPPVRSYDQPITTACGSSPSMDEAAAFYCPSDQRVFYAVDRDRPLFYRTSLEIDTTLAHEFGHALQGRTGIISASWAFRSEATEDVALEYSRRTELQADCLGGMAMNALGEATGLTATEREMLQADNYSRGDRDGYPRTHGKPENGLRWITTGLESLSAGVCNTFIASSDEVA